jgi:hypothetical protein
LYVWEGLELGKLQSVAGSLQLAVADLARRGKKRLNAEAQRTQRLAEEDWPRTERGGE